MSPVSPFPPRGYPFPEDAPVPVPGILVRPDREPVTPTIVFTNNYKQFTHFCYKCRVNAGSPDLKYAGEGEETPFTRYYDGRKTTGEERRWKHIAFVGINPVGYYCVRGDNAWFDIERMRRNNLFTRAFYYPEVRFIVPNVTDEGRSWD